MGVVRVIVELPVLHFIMTIFVYNLVKYSMCMQKHLHEEFKFTQWTAVARERRRLEGEEGFVFWGRGQRSLCRIQPIQQALAHVRGQPSSLALGHVVLPQLLDGCHELAVRFIVPHNGSVPPPSHELPD